MEWQNDKNDVSQFFAKTFCYKWYLMGGGVTWDSCPEVIHIEVDQGTAEYFFIKSFGRLDGNTYLCNMVEQEMKREMGKWLME